MNSQALLSTSALRRVRTLSAAFLAAMFAGGALALPEPKVTITYSLEPPDGGAYFQKVSGTPSGLGDADYVFDVVDSGDPDVDILVASPLLVVMEFTADVPGGNIVDGPVELVDSHFEREWEINSSGLTLVHTTLSTVLERKGTGILSGSTITWDNVVAPYQESVIGEATCTGFGCAFVTDPFPRDLSGTFDVVLPTFTVFADQIFGDGFASDNGTPGDPSDDIDRPAVDATVKDTWVGVEVPEPSRETLLLAGALGLVGLGRLRERGMHRR